MTTPRHQRPARIGRFLFGAPYYPEHWSPADRAEDIDRMLAANVNTVRMMEFAWDRIEPARDAFDFALFDETIATLHEADIDTILCTPTATPPRWLTAENEEWFRVDSEGNRMAHGSRQHCCTNNLAFRAESRRITAVIAEHFANTPGVIGWQTDNEFYCHVSECYCPACQAGFQQWLAEKYGSIDKLNHAWGTAFWAQTYDEFSQVPLPYPASRPAVPNPSHELDWTRFLSDSVRAFQREQVRLLRQANADWWITHNGLFKHIDYWTFTEDLDFLAVDVYPGFGADTPDGSAWATLKNQQTRAASGSFIVPEQQGGAGGQKPALHPAVPPGRMRLWAWQSIANGADGMLHFRWRTCRYGAEIYWNGILDHDNIPRRRYDEFAQIGSDLQAAGPALLGTVQDVRVAILTETDQIEAHKTQPNGLPGPEDVTVAAWQFLQRNHYPVGLVETRDSFAGLELIVLPSMPLIDEDLTARLDAFVRGGGTLLVTARSAVRDRNNHVLPITPPGPLAGLLGMTCEEFGRLVEPGRMSFDLAGQDVPSGESYENLKPTTAEILASWNPLPAGAPSAAAGEPALTCHRMGKGAAFYLGTYLTAGNASALLGRVLAETTIQPLASADGSVEITRRIADGRALRIVLNHSPRPQTVTNLPAGEDLLTDQPCTGELALPPYGPAVLREA